MMCKRLLIVAMGLVAVTSAPVRAAFQAAPGPDAIPISCTQAAVPFIEQGVAAAQDIASSNPLDFYQMALATDPSCVSARVLIAVGDPS